METWSFLMKTHSTVLYLIKQKHAMCNIHDTVFFKKKAKISTRQILFTPKTLNFDIAKNTSLKVVELPRDRTPVGSKWVFKLKNNADGSIERYKARLIAQGFSQKFGTDYDETFCPVVRMESLRTLIALAVQNGLILHQVDVTTAFLAERFDIKDMGSLHYFLGMKVIQNDETNEVWIGHPAYTKNLLQKFGMESAKPVKTPVDTSTKLVKATESEESIDQQLYQSAVGSLLYLSVGTRSDIAYAVSNVAKYSSHPTNKHWVAVKQIMRYLKGTTDMGLLYTKEGSSKCVGYSDSDWGGDLDDRKSTSGYLFQIGGGPVSWRSKKQSSVALSTAEAEYMFLASAGQEAVWMRLLTAELHGSQMEELTIFEDNHSAIQMHVKESTIPWACKTHWNQRTSK